MTWLGLGWHVRLMLEKLGVSEGTAFQTECKIQKFESWIMRHPITILIVELPDDMPNNTWTNVEASLDDTHVELVSTKGIWRKTMMWKSKARVNKEK